MGFVVAAGVTVAGGVMSANAAKKAGDQQAGEAQKALDFQKGVYNETTANLAPYRGTGVNALGSLSQLYGLPAVPGSSVPAGNALDSFTAFTKTPFYQFPLQQGVDERNRAAASKGLSLSGGQLASLDKYSQGYASQGFDGYIKGLASLANLGESASVQQGQQGNTAAQNVSSTEQTLGNALAAGTIGQNNGIQKALGAVPGLLGYGSDPTGSGYGSSSSNPLAQYTPANMLSNWINGGSVDQWQSDIAGFRNSGGLSGLDI